MTTIERQKSFGGSVCLHLPYMLAFVHCVALCTRSMLDHIVHGSRHHIRFIKYATCAENTKYYVHLPMLLCWSKRWSIWCWKYDFPIWPCRHSVRCAVQPFCVSTKTAQFTQLLHGYFCVFFFFCGLLCCEFSLGAQINPKFHVPHTPYVQKW